ncbi:adenylate/guanylate cyclase domain-containing protein [Dongia sp.]|uniref:adenylate/guanylate cyclase domain-containing protein n=1 Tax=Dongia sp. TaxID=1977262 RepID=UPI0035B2D2E8
MTAPDSELYAWLAEASLRGTPLRNVMEGFCAQINAAGLDLARALIATAALDPSIRAQSLIWEPETGSQMESFPHGESSIAWREGPLVVMIRSGTGMMRRRLGQPLAIDDYALFAELKEQGFTDWIAYAHWFHWEVEHIEGGGMGMVSSWATRDPAGFSDGQLDFLRPRVGALAAAVKSLVVVESACNVLSAYVGEDAGHRVMRGAITRGSATDVRAVLLFADLRGFTRFSAEQPIDVTLDTLNRSFDCVGEAIAAQGGQILKFMGDGVLAIFLLGQETPDEMVADRAITAAVEAQRRLGAAELPLSLDIALHVGHVSYGNIGTARRLDFTVIGQAVNEVARMESLCGKLSEPILISGALADMALTNKKRLRPLGSQALRGLDGKMPLYGL